jgi:hypothetical protein
VSRVLWLISVGEHFFDVNLEFHILEGEVADIAFVSRSLLFLHNVFSFLPQGKLWELSFFPEGGFLSPPLPGELWVTFVIWWVFGALLQDVVLFGVTVGDWELLSSGPFPFCLYDSLVLSIFSRLPMSLAGVPESLLLGRIQSLPSYT